MYYDAAKVANNFEKFGIGVKHQIYNPKYVRDPKTRAGVSFLVNNAFKKKTEIDGLLKRTGLRNKLKEGEELWLGRVLTVELVFGRLSFDAKDPVLKLVYSYKKELQRLGSGMKMANTQEIPRYVRVNTLQINLKGAVEYLESNGFELVELGKGQKLSLSFLSSKVKYTYDPDVPALLAFHPKAKVQSLDWVENGNLILQDKASCLVAPLLCPHPGAQVLDMCAAPGYKTQHLASVMLGHGNIYALDINKTRFEALKSLQEKFNLKNVHCINQDACENVETEEPIQYILLDPPCSGSGIVKNFDYSSSPKKNPERLKSLHNLQSKLLRKALNEFPSVRRIVYSTCSLTEEENEAVIDEFVDPPNGFVLVDLSCMYKNLPTGLTKYKCGTSCIRLSPEKDLTTGFFIAMFERSNPIKSIKRKADEIKVDRISKKQKKEIVVADEEDSSSDEMEIDNKKNEMLEKNVKNGNALKVPSGSESDSDQQADIVMKEGLEEEDEESDDTENGVLENGAQKDEGAGSDESDEEDSDNSEEGSDNDENGDADSDNTGTMISRGRGGRADFRGRGGRGGDMRGRGGREFRGRGQRGDFRGRGRGDFRGRGRGDFRGRGRGDFKGRGRGGDFRGRGRGDFRGRGRGDFKGRGRGDFRGRGRGGFRGGRGSFGAKD